MHSFSLQPVVSKLWSAALTEVWETHNNKKRRRRRVETWAGRQGLVTWSRGCLTGARGGGVVCHTRVLQKYPQITARDTTKIAAAAAAANSDDDNAKKKEKVGKLFFL